MLGDGGLLDIYAEASLGNYCQERVGVNKMQNNFERQCVQVLMNGPTPIFGDQIGVWYEFAAAACGELEAI